jgi:hypothetical protein
MCTTEEQHSLVNFFWAKGLNVKNIRNKCFLLMLERVCRVKRLGTGSRQSKDFCAEGFDSLVKRRNRCISVGGGYIEN